MLQENGSYISQFNEKCSNKGPVTSGNPVQRLEDHAAMNLWPPLVYDFFVVDCSHHKKYFCSISCPKFPDRVIKASGRCRRAARRNAASAFLKLLSEHSEDELVTAPPEKSTSNGTIKGNSKKLTTPRTEDALLSEFLKDLKLKTGKTLACIQLMALDDEAANFCQLLQEVAEEQAFEVVYKDSLQKTPQGEFLCTLHISSDLLIFSATGPTPTHAHKKAAHEALQFLKHITRKE